MSESIEYQRTGQMPYPHQVIVRTAPGWLASLFGAQPTERTFVCDTIVRGHEGTGWIEVPSMESLSNIGFLADRIRRAIRQDFFVKGITETVLR